MSGMKYSLTLTALLHYRTKNSAASKSTFLALARTSHGNAAKQMTYFIPDNALIITCAP